MKKMGKREKIIVVVMILAVLYGVYAIFFESSVRKAEVTPGASHAQEMAQVDTLATSAGVALKDSKTLITDAYIIDELQKMWDNDPFFTGPGPEKQREEVAPFLYTGFIEHEEARLAIINGIDYRVGDELEIPGFTVLSILPSQVVIEDKEGKRQITIPFTEELR